MRSAIGLLLPCNVVLRQEPEGHIAVAFIDSHMMLDLIDTQAVREVADAAHTRLLRVRDSLQP